MGGGSEGGGAWGVACWSGSHGGSGARRPGQRVQVDPLQV